MDEQRLESDLTALLRVFGQGGTLAPLLDLERDHLEALYAQGLAHYEQGRWSDALTIFGGLLMLDHAEPRYLNAVASTQQMLGHHAQALQYWGISQVLSPLDPAPTFHCANSLLAMGCVAEARDALGIVIAQTRDDPAQQALHTRARALLALIGSHATDTSPETPR